MIQEMNDFFRRRSDAHEEDGCRVIWSAKKISSAAGVNVRTEGGGCKLNVVLPYIDGQFRALSGMLGTLEVLVVVQTIGSL